MHLAERCRRVQPSGIRRIFELAATLRDPIDFSIGQADFDVPEPVKDAAIRAIREGHNRYTVTQGLPELNARVQALVKERHGFSPGASLITSGVSGGLLLGYLALLDPGDEILIPDPWFVMYQVLADLVGARAVPYETYPDFAIRREALERAVSPRTRVLLLNSPANPTGHVATRDELDEVAAFAREHRLTIVSDEIYDAFTYGGRYESVASLHADTLLLSGFSKTLGMPGWRIGYAVGRPDLLDAMKTFQQFTFVCANSVAQHAALYALDHDLSEQVKAYAGKRDRVVAALAGRYRFAAPGGSFYVFPEVPRKGESGTRFAERLLEQRVLVVPGKAFSGRDTHFRLSFAAPDDRLDEGLAVLRAAAE